MTPATLQPAGIAAAETVQIGPWSWTPWPIYPLPTVEWLRTVGEQRGPRWLDDFHARRENAIRQEQAEPLEFGWEQPPVAVLRALLAGTYRPGMLGQSVVPPDWAMPGKANDVAMLGGTGSGKSEVQAKFIVETLVKIPGSEARVFSQNETTNRRYLQTPILRYLPRALRKVKKLGQTVKISYTESTGFSENVFILPLQKPARQGSACFFFTYKGWEQDRKSVEGGECDILTWDEEAPRDMMQTVRFRAHKKGGLVLGGFTPVDGYTDTVAEYLHGATALEIIPARAVVWRPVNDMFLLSGDAAVKSWTWGEWLLPADRELVKGCPPGHLPLVLQCAGGRGRRFVLILPTLFNPYTNVAAIAEDVADKPAELKLERLWGWPTHLVKKACPDFSTAHIVKPARVPPLRSMTLWHLVDPHGNRNWFQLWIGVDANDWWWILKEWPDADMGEWALPGGKSGGKPGPAQTAGSRNAFNDYKRLIHDLEGRRFDAQGRCENPGEAWDIKDRFMDPRPANLAVPNDEEAQTYRTHMASPVQDRAGKILLPGLDFAAGPHCGIQEGCQIVNDRLTQGWNPREPLTPMNCPQTYVSEACPNLIFALRTLPEKMDEKDPSKDPFDCLKLAAKIKISYYAPGSLGSYGGAGSYGGVRY